MYFNHLNYIQKHSNEEKNKMQNTDKKKEKKLWIFKGPLNI